MTQFKKGDLVRRIKHALVGVTGPYGGEPFRVVDVDSKWVTDEYGGAHYFKNIELAVTEEEEAQKLQTYLGYKIQPTPGKRKCQVVIYRWTNDKTKRGWECIPKEYWDERFNYHEGRTDLQLIAIVDWTEGDGI